MSDRTALWTVEPRPERLPLSELPSELLLEDMIVAAPELLSDDWMLVGRQASTGFGGRIDLLGIRPDGSLLLVELKRGRTPRDVVAQALDYASWVQHLDAGDVAEMFDRLGKGSSLAEAFRNRFGFDLEEEAVNNAHQIVVVASSIDASTERIVDYLGDQGVSINVLCFQVFSRGAERLLSRSWLLDPVQVPASTSRSSGPPEPWNGEFYCSFGHGVERSWEDARELGFVSAGGGNWYSRTLQMLSEGDRIWVKVPGTGFVGVGEVAGSAQAAGDFVVETEQGPRPVLEVAKRASYLRDRVLDPDMCEYFVAVRWFATVSLDKAVYEVGLFGNQNTVCKPTAPKWRHTVELLKKRFAATD